MQDKPVALVTGANKGIGLQIAKNLTKQGFTVLVGSRSLENGETASKASVQIHTLSSSTLQMKTPSLLLLNVFGTNLVVSMYS